jgi:hypothetical protein
MPDLKLQNANFGPKRADQTGSLGVGYAILDENGAVVAPRTTSGVYQLASGSGLYAAYVSWPDAFSGQILWDCPAFTGSSGNVLAKSSATEQYNVEQSYTYLSGTIGPQVQGIYDVAFGRWKIDKVANTMTFYRAGKVTVVAVFDLFDDTGAPTFDGVFERVLVGSVTP